MICPRKVRIMDNKKVAKELVRIARFLSSSDRDDLDKVWKQMIKAMDSYDKILNRLIKEGKLRRDVGKESLYKMDDLVDSYGGVIINISTFKKD